MEQTYPSYELVPNLHPYQKYIHDFILQHPYCGLFLDCGLGKTLISLATLYDLNPHHHVLVIAPKHIARSTWLDEIDKWNFPFRTKSFIVDDKGKNITKAKSHALIDEIFEGNQPSTIYFINRERLVDLIENLPTQHIGNKDIPVFPFKTVILDESQSFKSRSSKRFQALQLVRPQIERLIELTGTPAPNGVEDLWSQIYLLDEGKRLGKNITTFRRWFYNTDYDPYGRYNLKPNAEDTIYKLISDITVSVDNPNIELPDISYNYLYVHMSPSEKTLYDSLERDAVLELVKKEEENTDVYNVQTVFLDRDDDNCENKDFFIANEDAVIAQNAAVLSMKLMQMASGNLYVNEEHDTTHIHNRKIEMLEHIIDETNSPVMVAYYYQSDLANITEVLTKDGYTIEKFDGSPEMIKRWNNNEINVMLLHPASAGHGLNLQEGDGHTLVWYTVPWSLELYLQTNARLHRQGQKNAVVIHHILTKDTIDEDIVEAINNKDFSQQRLLEAVKGKI